MAVVEQLSLNFILSIKLGRDVRAEHSKETDHFIYITRHVLPSRSSLLFGHMVKFGPMVFYLFSYPVFICSGFGLMDPPLSNTMPSP